MEHSNYNMQSVLKWKLIAVSLCLAYLFSLPFPFELKIIKNNNKEQYWRIYEEILWNNRKICFCWCKPAFHSAKSYGGRIWWEWGMPLARIRWNYMKQITRWNGRGFCVWSSVGTLHVFPHPSIHRTYGCRTIARQTWCLSKTNVMFIPYNQCN